MNTNPIQCQILKLPLHKSVSGIRIKFIDWGIRMLMNDETDINKQYTQANKCNIQKQSKCK